MFPIPPVKEELMMLCVPNCITHSASEFRRTVYAELIKELTREKQLLDQVAATAADRPEALLLACDTSCVPKEVAEQKGRLLQEGVAQTAQQKLQACEAKVSELNARIARMRSDVEAEKAHKGEDVEMWGREAALSVGARCWETWRASTAACSSGESRRTRRRRRR